MSKRKSLLVVAGAYLGLVVACSTVDGQTSKVGELRVWADAMAEIVNQKDEIESEFNGPVEEADLALVARSARRAAELMARGYGPLEVKNVRGFAGYARAAEAWFLQIALEAKSRRATIVRDLIDQGVKKHCNECHDAGKV